jgi:hypothetical protein
MRAHNIRVGWIAPLVCVLSSGSFGIAGADDAATPPSSVEAPQGPERWTPLTIDALNVTIIESQSYLPGHDMDVEWYTVATGMGNTATIAPQSTLDNLSNLAGTDILIVSSGVIDLIPARVQTIIAFLQSSHPVYLQGEYLCNYSTNLAFESIVSTLGGTFTGGGTSSGMLEPMNVTTTLSSIPNSVPTITGFWYGCHGTGDGTITPFLEYSGEHFGFIFIPPQANDGRVIFTTDQDWCREANFRPQSGALMENILAYLGSTSPTPVHGITWGAVKTLYR